MSMPRPLPPHLMRQVTQHDRVVWYVRIGKGPRIRLRQAYDTPEFWEAYRAALAGNAPADAPKAARGTLAWLWDLYRQSAAWRDLSSATRRQRENIMRHVLASAGKEPLSRISRATIIQGRDRRTPAQAKNFVSSMRGMFRWAAEVELAPDPTQGVKRRAGKTRSQGFPVWTIEDIEQFERRWPIGTRERVMFDIFLYTGLRRGDAAIVGRQHVRNGEITIDTEKTGMRVTIPILAELQATLDAGPTGDLAFISTKAGNPMPKESVGNAFRDACRAAGIRKSAHGLRKAAATRAAENGATERELEAIFGWTGGQMASLYTRSANRRSLSTGAVIKMSKTGTETPSPGDEVRAPERKTE